MNVIAVGPPGVGKSHLAAALGHELILQGHPVLWTTAATLVQRLPAAERDLRRPQELAKLDRFPCLVLDDIGDVQHDRDEMEVLSTPLAERYERRSVVLTTNRVFSDWDRIFKDPMTTVAAIDRVVHHSVILDLMSVTSYRAKEAQQHREALPAVAAPRDRKEQLSSPAVLLDARHGGLCSALPRPPPGGWRGRLACPHGGAMRRAADAAERVRA